MDHLWNLADIEVGECCHVTDLSAEGAMRRRLLDIGLVRGAQVRCVGKSPGGDPRAYRICGAVIALRARDARDVWVQRGVIWV